MSAATCDTKSCSMDCGPCPGGCGVTFIKKTGECKEICKKGDDSTPWRLMADDGAFDMDVKNLDGDFLADMIGRDQAGDLYDAVKASGMKFTFHLEDATLGDLVETLREMTRAN